MTVTDKIGVLADAAKYDASCSTAGSARENTPGGIGNGVACGICHSWSADGRCVALLKVLLSNVCSYDCAYCVNRRSSDVRRATFEPEELVSLIMDFYRRNYIEGAFLSSGVLGCPDATMERLIGIARTLRRRERFNGYIHMKVIPGTSEELVLEAARWADRVSVNIEMPSAESLARIAPDKKPEAIFRPMRTLARAAGFEPRKIAALPESRPALQEPSGLQRDAVSDYSGPSSRIPGLIPASPPEKTAFGQSATPEAVSRSPGLPSGIVPVFPGEEQGRQDQAAGTRDRVPSGGVCPEPLYAADGRPLAGSVKDARRGRMRDAKAAVLPAGQTTQMVVGASPESDRTILSLSENLYLAYDVRRVYYSAFVPVVHGDSRVPTLPGPPLAREHRLYQADWLFRFYGFAASEILEPGRPWLDRQVDPKCDWALRHPEFFPVELAKAEYRILLRIPGIGPKAASRIVSARRSGSLSPQVLRGLGVVMRRARWFITVNGRIPDDPGSSGYASLKGAALERPDLLRRELADPAFRSVTPGQFEFDWESSP